jgi:hypothetical protein
MHDTPFAELFPGAMPRLGIGPAMLDVLAAAAALAYD